MVSIANRSIVALSVCLVVLENPGAAESGRSPVVLPGADTSHAALRPSALASADFDGDGMPDLAVGYEGAEVGAVVLYRGNVDALFPDSPEARQRRDAGAFVGHAFLPGARTIDLPFAVDLLGAGDLDNDGRADLVAGTRGGDRLHFLSGDGAGGLSPAVEIPLAARLVAMTVGDVNRADGVPDVVVSVAEPTGPALLVFESPAGAVYAEPETIRVPAQPTWLELAPIRGRRLVDIVAAAADELLIVEGRDRRLLFDAPWKPEVAPPRLQRLTLPSPIESLACGDFLPETDPREELAGVTSAGTLVVFDLEQDGDALVLKSAGSDHSLGSGATVVAAHVSGRATEDLLVLDAAGGPVELMSGLGRADSQADGESPPAEIAPLKAWAYPDVTGGVRAVLPMRLNPDARPAFVLLQEGLLRPTLAFTAPQAVITVNSNLDVTTAGDGLCTLREAINNANVNGQTTGGDCAAGVGLDTIAFAIGGGGSVVSIAVLAPALPAITDSVVIDGTTQGCPAPPCIELNGSGAGAGVIGLRLTGAGGNTMRGLVVNRFSSHGIYATTSANIIEGNRVGTDTTGMLAQANGAAGIRLNGTGATSNTIGGTVVAARNLVSGNSASGIVILDGPANNTVVGNHVGINATGSSAIPQGGSGILLQGVGTTSNTVGGTTPGAGNVTSGNTFQGIVLNVGPTSNTVQGNLSGVDPTGSTALGNGSNGIWVYDSSSNLIGGTAPGARNLVSGNAGDGMLIGNTSDDNDVTGNYVGVDVTGSLAVPNAIAGIELDHSSLCTIGGTVPGAGNLVSGNAQYGILLDVGSNGNTVAGNHVGINATGSAAVPNNQVGIWVYGATGNTVGPGNVVSGNYTLGDPNTGFGILLGSGADGNSIVGNFVGTDPTGTFAIGNARAGIRLQGASENVVGGTTPEARNISSGNGRNGVGMVTSANNNQVLGNYFGLDVTGTQAIPNGGDGAEIEDATGNTIGPGNVISGNAEVGVFLESNAVGNSVRGNYVGTDATGTTVIGNGLNGIQVGCTPLPGSCGVGAATSNVIGGTTSDARNVIAGSGGDGVFLMNAANDNVVQGNAIGTDATGTLALGNSGSGVRVLDSNGVRIGGSSAGEGNQIVNNGAAGVVIHGTSMDSPVLGNVIAGNALLGIDLGESDGVTPNDPADADTGPNGMQNFPVLTSVQSSASGVVAVAGTLDSTPLTSFHVEFFANGSCDASGHGEGARLLGATDVATDGAGTASFSNTLPSPVAAGEMVTATATSATGSTSEFSACAAASCSSLATFAATVVATDKGHLSWPGTADVRWAKGFLSQLAGYATTGDGTLFGAVGLDIAADQSSAGTGLYYIVRPLYCGSWQSIPGAEPGRDSALP